MGRDARRLLRARAERTTVREHGTEEANDADRPSDEAGKRVVGCGVPWVSCRLRGVKVFAACDEQGVLCAGADARADVMYSQGGKVYRAAVRNLQADDDPAIHTDQMMAAAPRPSQNDTGTGPAATRPKRPNPKQPPKLLESAVHIYTDGACTGNPGPMGIGVVVLDPASGNGQPTRLEYSEYLGHGTNNIAELTAILRGLSCVSIERAAVVYSDSAYSIGVLSLGWKARANPELVAQIRARIAQFPVVDFVKVRGHAGVPENERCDELARQALLRGR